MPTNDSAVSNRNGKWSWIAHPDRISGGFLIILACIAIYVARDLPFGSLRKPEAGFFPLSLSVLLLVFGAVITINSFRREAKEFDFSARSWYVVIASAAFILYAISLEKVGYILATSAIMLLVLRGLGGMRWVRALLIAIPSVLVSYVAFVKLGVPLPQGLLPF